MMQDVDLRRCRALFARNFDDECLEHDDCFYEALWDYVTGHGVSVFVLEWDSGGPGGGAGTESVHSFQDFFFTTSVDFGFAGPFDTLDEALEHLGFVGKEGLIRINEATREIRCLAWTEEELIRRLDLETFDLPNMLVLNENAWEAEELTAKRQALMDDEAMGRA